MTFSPVNASKELTTKYKRYLQTIFQINDKTYQNQFTRLVNQDSSYAKGPFLDVTDAFEKGRSIDELIAEGVLSKTFSKINMPHSRPLYKHQEEALRQAQKGSNLVVSTGTGSGKTECFLIPIFDYLLRQYEEQSLGNGIRALIVYPMNALANDQIERLRGLLMNFSHITYGCYTGQTKGKYSDALADYKKLNNGEIPIKNELISREQMKETPPNILITNYAMLEYLMLRPGDSIFFEGQSAASWKFIVMDEAHVYNGSTGIEVSMLLRRLKAKINKEDLTYILTSATLGGQDSNAEVAEFATNLCNSSFKENSIIRAKRIKPHAEREKVTLPIRFYKKISRLLESEADDEEVKSAIQQYTFYDMHESLDDMLYDMVLHDNNYWDIRSHLTTPKTVSRIAEAMGWSEEDVESFVRVAGACHKDGGKLFDARYHMFLKATESVFVTLNPSNKMVLTRMDTYMEGSEEFKVFEIATCSYCHAIYLIGKEDDNGILQQSSSMSEDNLKDIFMLGDSVSDIDEDDTLEDEKIEYEQFEICAKCGHISRPGVAPEFRCKHDRKYYTNAFKVKVENDSHTLTKCLACENTNTSGVLRMFFTGQEACTSVIGTALFEELPSYSIKHEVIVNEDDSGFDYGFKTDRAYKEKKAKQFIAFSDSRQAAAFYATYLNQTYKNILYKRLIVEVLKEDVYSGTGKSFDDFIDDLICQFEKYGINENSSDSITKEAWIAALSEFVDNNGNTSMYRMGLIGINFDKKLFRDNMKLNLKAEDIEKMCTVFALGIMADNAITYKANLAPAERERYSHNGIENSYTLSDSNPKLHRKSFIPTKSHMTNKRLEYFIRVLRKAGNAIDDIKARDILEKGIWKHIFEDSGNMKSSDGNNYKLDVGKLIISRPSKWYICPKCRKITTLNVLKVCPSFKCDGELQEIDIEDLYKNNHYFNMYKKMDIRELRVCEHTAQLNKETAYEYQRKFKQKELDVLSCSTTFEMGVDVGSLETVFMRNMPPSPANYAQRAGRAGRSTNSAAYAITFCNKSSHDFTFFKNPESMIKGNIQPPKFVINNSKIAIRHVYSSTLGFFWRRYPQYFSRACNITEKDVTGHSGYDVLSTYLNEHPCDLKDYLLRFLPKSLSDRFNVVNFGWVKSLISEENDNEGVLTKALIAYDHEVKTLEEAVKRNDEAGKRTDALRERIRVFKNEEVIAFLSRKNVLPKYGFPVDSVEMSIVDKTNKIRLGLQLQRDLSIALSEYAPDSQIVANGYLITSRYIKKVPNMNWKQYDYIVCKSCNALNIDISLEDDSLSKLIQCNRCNAPLNVSSRRTFLIPEFGFEADGDDIKVPGLKKPEKTYKSEVSYIGDGHQAQFEQFKIGNGSFEVMVSPGDKMAIMNSSNFYVCESCGYAVLRPNEYTKRIKKSHKMPSGYWCKNDGTNTLKRFALGYTFETDIVQLKFINPDLYDYDIALSVLYGILRGASSCLNIEQNDISGCLEYFNNEITHRGNFSLILYDKTPGGAGHARRLNDERVLEKVLEETLRLMEQCDCGGEKMDSSCYGCLRSYYNQKYHDRLKRGHVVNVLKEILK